MALTFYAFGGQSYFPVLLLPGRGRELHAATPLPFSLSAQTSHWTDWPGWKERLRRSPVFSLMRFLPVGSEHVLEGKSAPSRGQQWGCPWSPVLHDDCCHSPLVLTTRDGEICSLFGFLKNPHGVLFLMTRKQLWGNV